MAENNGPIARARNQTKTDFSSSNCALHVLDHRDCGHQHQRG
jgi:hypothetical protein